MKYIGEQQYQHGSSAHLGVMLVNLGTPDDTSTKSVRRYLKQFLSDPRVVEVPRLLWWLILHGVILRFRPRRTAAAYQTVWDETSGSPLLSIGTAQRDRLRELFAKPAASAQPNRQNQTPLQVELAMRYGSPSVASALENFRLHGVRRLLVLPLYPQYSGSTVASVFDEVARELSKVRWIPEMRFINQYFDDPGYISALAQSVRNSWEQNGRGQLLVMSFHGIPERYRTQGDPYFCQCQASARLLAEALELTDDNYRVVFQSRFGREPWLSPYCDKTLEQLPGEGITEVDIICPGFSADCLETIEEINEENREIFLHAGGNRFHYIAALNDNPDHLQALVSLIERHASGWPEFSPALQPADMTASRARALAMGAPH